LAGCDKPNVSSEDRETAESAPKKPPLPLPKSKWDPPTDIPHLESTSLVMRARIDRYVAILFDPLGGQDSIDAQTALIAIGKAAFPRVLSRMARMRDVITDVDSHDEHLAESSLKLADECLREMDGWLTAKGKSTLRPGSKRDYIQYICRLHYKRWEMWLKHLDKMPGPYDPTEKYRQK
jgi:hypothetical protein